MKRKYCISVAIATYNGEKFIKEQLDSILCQIDKQDEIIISDDGSTDDTLNIIKSYDDDRIRIVNGPHAGVKQNFANAISKSKGKYILLSDQDDIWMKNKVDIILDTFEKEKCTCILHDNITFDSNTEKIIQHSFFEFRNSRPGILKNIIKNSYMGCCMAFEEKMKEYFLPIPNNIEMHDQWIGIISEKYGKNIFINDKLIKYRRHNNNVTKLKHNNLIKMFTNRVCLIYFLIKRFKLLQTK